MEAEFGVGEHEDFYIKMRNFAGVILSVILNTLGFGSHISRLDDDWKKYKLIFFRGRISRG